MKRIVSCLAIAGILIGVISCKSGKKDQAGVESDQSASLSGHSSAGSGDSGMPSADLKPFVWENATIYFLLTDRFRNGDPENDVNMGRTQPTAPLRGFMGGDLRGIIEKLDQGYFDELGVNALWFSPVFEQIKGIVDEGTGDTYGFHGYWIRDWTGIEPNFGTEEDLAELVEKAHAKGIRVVMDVILNHTGPVTDSDPVWPSDWVRTEPKCDFNSYEGSITCTLVENLPDILTESDEPVDLPPFLFDKWEKEGRLEQELAELDAFFNETGYPRAPKYYIMKWLTDLIRDYGIDGFRIDTGRHVEESVWQELIELARKTFSDWKKQNPEKSLDDNEFYTVGEVYNYKASSMYFDFGDKKVNYYDYGYSGLINFEFKTDVTGNYETLFSKYSELLNGALAEYGTVNYITSHDDAYCYDRQRKDPFESGTKLLLCPGTVQIYYGDETARILEVPQAVGDAQLRSAMNWEELSENAMINGSGTADVLAHWQKLGRFRNAHPSVGAGVHKMVSEKPYLFTRSYNDGNLSDGVFVGLGLKPGKSTFVVDMLFKDGTRLMDYYSGRKYSVESGSVDVEHPGGIVLLGEI